MYLRWAVPYGVGLKKNAVFSLELYKMDICVYSNGTEVTNVGIFIGGLTTIEEGVESQDDEQLLRDGLYEGIAKIINMKFEEYNKNRFRNLCLN